MKDLICFITISFYMLISNSCSAQNRQDSASVKNYIHTSLINKINKSDAIIEGKVIATRNIPNDLNVSVTIRVSKIFKGDINNSIIELIIGGGKKIDTMQDGTIQEVYAVSTYPFTVQNGEEGIFFLNDNKTGKRLEKDLQSYIVTDVWLNDLLYSQKKGEHYIASYEGAVFKDVEKDVFQVIESTTGQKRKVLSQYV